MFSRAKFFSPFAETESIARLGAAAASDFGPTIKMISWNMFKARRRGCMPDLTSMSAGVELVPVQWSFWMLSWLVRAGLVRDAGALLPLLAAGVSQSGQNPPAGRSSGIRRPLPADQPSAASELRQ